MDSQVSAVVGADDPLLLDGIEKSSNVYAVPVK
jgi:hypothetical protein